MTKEGTVLDGKYEILKEIGRGGMSIVYLARDNRLNKQWAVKEMKNDGTKTRDTLLKGLEREANILKDVDHPVLPRIVDIINSRGTIYVVMDFVFADAPIITLPSNSYVLRCNHTCKVTYCLYLRHTIPSFRIFIIALI